MVFINPPTDLFATSRIRLVGCLVKISNIIESSIIWALKKIDRVKCQREVREQPYQCILIFLKKIIFTIQLYRHYVVNCIM